jgi:hypothetical protein
MHCSTGGRASFRVRLESVDSSGETAMAKKVCEHCGASMMEYKHSLSVGLLEGLLRLYRQRKPVNLAVLNLNHSQWDNFQKLKYWGLVEKFRGAGTNAKGGIWTITTNGIDFVTGRVKVQKSVWTYRGEFRRFDGEEVNSHQIHDAFKTVEDYRREMVPHLEGAAAAQLGLW